MPDAFDLTQAWASDPEHTAQILTDTMRTAMDCSDKAPIREHYRNASDAELRATIAYLMGADR